MSSAQKRSERVNAGPRVGLATYVIGLTVLWTLTLTASLGWLLRQQRLEEKAAAAITARVSYEADVKYLSWLSALGGLFVNAEVEFPPDPHLGGGPGRGILLPDGTKLMPLTPIYVLRLVHALDITPLEVSSRLSSLTPVVPEDVPDPWEAEALGALTRGQREVVDIAEIDGDTYLRLMKPLRLGQDCINCHEKEGFQEGVLQGGISVTVPMDRPDEFGRRSDAYLYAVHGILWLLGTGFIGYGARSLSARIRERDQALEEVSDERNFSDSVLETVGALVVVLDPDGHIIRFNRACEDATGYGFAEVRNREVWDLLLLPEDRESFRERFDRLRIDRAPTSHETHWVGKDGARRIISWFDRPLVSAKGTVGHVIATGIDVTEKRQMELALEESEERYRGLVESSPDAVFVHQDGRFVFCNEAGARLLGAAGPRDLVGKPILDFAPLAHGEVPPGCQGQWLPEALSEQTLRGLDGELVEAEVAGIPFRYRGREAVQVIARDIGARKRAEQALRDSEARYRTLVENVDLGITLVGQDYRVVMANAAQGRLLNRDPVEFVDKLCFREFEGRDSVCPHCPGGRAMRSGASASVETVRARGDGVSVPVRVQAFPILGPDGEVNGFIEVTEDITALKNAEEERLRLEQKFVQTQKLESLGVLAGGIAHDFNNLLMGVVGNVDLALLKAPPDSPLRSYLQKIDDAAQRAADLTNQMLAYSGKGRIVVEQVHMSRLVEEVGHLLDTVVSKKATLQYQLAPELPPVEADATQLRQVVMNLITNASDAVGDRAGTVTVSTGLVHADRAYLAGIDFGDSLVEGPYVYFDVSDTGCGMNRETQRKVFEPFFTTKQTGRGLGLAAVLGIVRGHKGGLRVYSESGRGTAFRVYLPASGACGEEPENATGAGGASEQRTGRGCILLVDDDAMVREVTRDMLEEHGFTVLTAADGVEGVERFREHTQAITAVVLDMTMPRMNGEETYRELRKLRRDIPVIICSGYNEQDTGVSFADKTISGFVHKPYRATTLLNKLEELIEGTRKVPSAGRSRQEVSVASRNGKEDST